MDANPYQSPPDDFRMVPKYDAEGAEITIFGVIYGAALVLLAVAAIWSILTS